MEARTKIRKSSPFAAITILVFIVILFIGFYIVMRPYAILFSTFTDDGKYYQYTTEEECRMHGGSYYDSICHQLPARALSVIKTSRNAWLITPIIFVVGLILWLFSAVTRKDPTLYEGMR